MQIAFIDHYDSFGFNVLDWLERAGHGNFSIKRITAHDEAGLARLKKDPIPLVISPGPGNPADYPLTQKLLREVLPKVPVLGVCLGHQMIASLGGQQITRAKNPWHGTPSRIRVIQKNWFSKDLPQEFKGICYNSLVASFTAQTTSEWQVLAINDDDENMMMAHVTLPIASVQFHPESFGSEQGMTIARNFIDKILVKPN